MFSSIRSRAGTCVTVVSSWWLWAPRRSKVAAGLCAAAVLLAGCAVTVWVLSRPAPGEPSAQFAPVPPSLYLNPDPAVALTQCHDTIDQIRALAVPGGYARADEKTRSKVSLLLRDAGVLCPDGQAKPTDDIVAAWTATPK